MHAHCEIVLAPTDDIEAAVASILKPYDEDTTDRTGNEFWDWYVIGGRFAGSKQLAKYDQSQLQQFYDWLNEEKVTVSGMVCGKQALSPSSQIEKVDAKWNEMFPSSGGVMVACPIFQHSNDQYGRNGKGTIDGDICPLGDALTVKCSRVIFAGPSWVSESKEHVGPPTATFMLCEDQWNGVNHMPIKWDGTIGDALTQFRQKLDHYNDTYRDSSTPTDDWLTVTVDYHS